MKTGIRLPVITIAASLVLIKAALAQDFSADAVTVTKGVSAKGKVFESVGKARIETDAGITITRIDMKVVWVLMPSEKTYMEKPLDTHNMMATVGAVPGEVERMLVGQEEMNGRAASKYRIVYKLDGRKETVEQWLDAALAVPVKTAASDGSWSIEYSNIKIGKQPEGVFEIPADYKKLSSGPNVDLHKGEIVTPLGTVRVGMTKEDLCKVFQEKDRMAIPHKILNEEWILFKNWPSKNPEDVITFYLTNDRVTGWKASYNPSPKNKGSIYEYNQDEKIERWFFPGSKARWDGSKVNALEWHKLMEVQKVTFITEYIEELQKEYNKDIYIDMNRYILAMNYYADVCPERCFLIPATDVIKDLLIRDGKIPAKG